MRLGRIHSGWSLLGLSMFGLSVLAVPLGLAEANAAPPVMAGAGAPDLSAMSGIPLVDGKTPAGTIVVRCLHGSFAAPAVGSKVELDVTTSDGETTTLEGVAAEKGRAIFSGLEPFVGGEAVARVVLGGESLRSRPISIAPDVGAAVMLVGPALPGAGAGAAASAAGLASPIAGPASPTAASPHGDGGTDTPVPGRPFPLPERPAGTVVVGVLDLAKGEPLMGLEIALHIERPGHDVEVRTQASNGDGRAVFEGLTAPDYPPETRVTVKAAFGVEGALDVSEAFALPETGVAVVLTTGRTDPSAAPHPTPKGPPALPPPRRDPQVPAGHVRVDVVGPTGEPIKGGKVEVVRQAMAGGGESSHGVTDGSGRVDVEVVTAPGSFHFVGIEYQGAPYRSGFFEVPDDVGAHVNLRVWPVTQDRQRLRSVVQFDVQPRENDRVVVSHIYAVMHDGDEAFWPAGGLRIDAPAGAESLQVLPGATAWLEAPEDAQYVTLTRPIPPGQEVRLSFAYLLDHDGEIDVDWIAPFPVMQGLVSLDRDLELTRGKEGPPREAPHGGGLDLYEFEPEGFQPTLCTPSAPEGSACGGTPVGFGVAGLPTRGRILRDIAAGLGVVFVIGVGFALIFAPRTDLRAQLLRRRDRLLSRLKDTTISAQERQQVVAALDSIYHQIDAIRSA